jgi:hypothetical protein
MNVARRPTVAFGRRGETSAASPSLVRPAMAVARPQANAGSGSSVMVTVGIAVLTCLLVVVVSIALRVFPDIGRARADSADATRRVIGIVNQPVTHLSRSGQVAIFRPGWFHPGATKPDFNTVDIRTTQDLLYSRYSHVSSDLNPTEMFIGSELEFNAMTKYFYTDRSLPKHRLSDAEMVEINGLYRLIGRDERASSTDVLTIAGLAVAAAVLGLGLLYLVGRGIAGALG